MKNLVIIILIALLCVAMIGSFATLGNSSGGGAGNDEGSATVDGDSSDELPDDGVYELTKDLTFYNHHYSVGDSSVQSYVATYEGNGECFDWITGEYSDRIYLGYSVNGDQRMLAYSFDDLIIGKTYLIHFIRVRDYPLSHDTLYYRFGSGGNFISFEFTPTDDRYTFLFTATATTFQLGVLKFSEAPSDQTLQAYATAIDDKTMFDLYEVLS